MAYKVSYKVVSEQGEALKKTAKDMDNYINQLDQIISKLGNDELFQSVREQLKKFRQQLEEERTVLNLAGQVITEVIQSYTGAEKKSVSKVDKAKAHNRDFYKRPVAVASAGGASAGAAASAVAGGGSVNVSAAASSVTNTTVIHNTTNVINSSPTPSASTTTSTPVTPVASTVTGGAGGSGLGEGMAAAAGALGAAATAAVAAGAAAVMKKKTESEVGTADVNVDGDVIDGTYVEV